MNIEDIATKADINELKTILLRVLEKQQENKQAKEWLRSKEVRTLLNISNGTLQNLRVKGLLHASKVQGVHYYRLSEIEALLQSNNDFRK